MLIIIINLNDVIYLETVITSIKKTGGKPSKYYKEAR